MTGLSHDATGVQQTIATVAGTGYDLSFWIGNNSDFASVTSTTLVSIDSAVGTSYTNSQLNATNGGLTVWQEFTQQFTATGSTTTISFTNEDPPTDGINQLDDVSVVSQVASTPEPSSMALLGTGLIGLGPVVRKRLKKR